MKAIIMAGGYAKRLWPLTKDKAKPLLPVGGKPMVDYIWGELEGLELEKVYVSTNELFAQQFQEWIESKSDARLVLAVEPTRSEEEKLGSIGAISLLIETYGIDDDLMIVAGDNLTEMKFSGFVNAFDGRPLVALYDLGDKAKAANKYGVVETRDGIVVGFEEKPAEPKTSLISSGFYIYPKETLPLFKEYLSEGNAKDAPGFFLEWLHKKAEVKAYVFSDLWYDIGDLESYEKANEIFSGE
ncbi:MAG: nucleotidyltransferase family protein [Candidatus Diapherotrites archaeon]|nr:nucleotidyltransferase family protein [Candidatus Diapherotrites archaeon]